MRSTWPRVGMQKNRVPSNRCTKNEGDSAGRLRAHFPFPSAPSPSSTASTNLNELQHVASTVQPTLPGHLFAPLFRGSSFYTNVLLILLILFYYCTNVILIGSITLVCPAFSVVQVCIVPCPSCQPMHWPVHPYPNHDNVPIHPLASASMPKP